MTAKYLSFKFSENVLRGGGRFQSTRGASGRGAEPGAHYVCVDHVGGFFTEHIKLIKHFFPLFSFLLKKGYFICNT